MLDALQIMNNSCHFCTCKIKYNLTKIINMLLCFNANKHIKINLLIKVVLSIVHKIVFLTKTHKKFKVLY